MTFRKTILFALLLLSPFVGKAQEAVFNDTIDRSAPDFVTVSLLIADPGEVLYSVLGHACLRLQCPTFNLDYVFSYESESVRGRVPRFLVGDLRMGMMAVGIEEYLQPYIEEGRGVREYFLDFPPEVKTELWRMCDERVAQGMQLEYDPVKRGCAISVVHSVEDAIASANRMTGSQYKIDYPEWGAPFHRTLREIFYDNAPHGWGLFWCMTLVGGVVDKPSLPNKEKLISPRELADVWMRSSVNGKPLVSRPVNILNEGSGIAPGFFTPLVVSLLLLLLSIIGFFTKNRFVDWFVLGLQTLLGCLVLWMVVMPLPASGWSWLIIPFNPLPALLWKWRKYWSLPYAVLIPVWCVAVLLAPHRLVEYAHIIFALSFAIILFKQRYKNT